jgi:amino acid adenylation domain-containing protein
VDETLYDLACGLPDDADVLLAPGRVACTGAGLAAQVVATAAGLRARGLGPQDVVAVVIPNGPEMASAFLGVASGAICAPLNPGYTGEEFRFYLEDLGARALVLPAGFESAARDAAAAEGVEVVELVTGDAAGRFELGGAGTGGAAGDALVAPRPDDVALVLHTSGTTSRPKQVPLTHRNLCTSAANIVDTLRLTPQDRCLNVMPLFHIHGLVAALLGSLAARGSLVCTPGFDPVAFAGWLEDFGPTWWTAVPTIHQAVLSATADGVAPQPRLRFLRSSSAALPPSVLAALEDRFGVPVVEAYGMTEAAHQMASNPLPPGERRPGSVGVAAGPEVAVMDEAGTLLPVGAVGEIVIRGENVTAGYLSNDEANVSAFSGGWFRTGDQGVLDEAGYLTITGRLKELINRGGEKIAPREVDDALLEHPAVAQAVTFAVPHPTLGEDVAAGVVPVGDASLDEDQLRRFVGERLAAFKVPRRIVVLAELPKGPTGKLQRIGLAERLGLGADADASGPLGPGSASAPWVGDPPANELEREVAGLWSGVLGGVAVGRDVDFVVAGGDSLAAMALLAQVQRRFGVELGVRQFFDDASTIAAMAELLGRRGPGASAPTPPAATPAAAEVVLSFTQEQLWLQEMLFPGTAAYNVPLALRLRGSLEVDAFAGAVRDHVERHAALRLRVPVEEGAPAPEIVSRLDLDIAVVDVAADPDPQAAAARIAAEQAARPFDLAAGPLVRALVVHSGPQDHLAVVVFHHLVTDGWSRDLFRSELAELYNARVQGRPAALERPAVEYASLAAWQRQMVESGALGGDLRWWVEELSPLPPVLELPVDRRRPAVAGSAGGLAMDRLPAGLGEQVRRVGRERGCTPFMVLVAAWSALLHQLAGQDDLVIGVPRAGRLRAETESVVGLFVNTVPLRSTLDEQTTVVELLDATRRRCLDAFDHDVVPFELVVDAVAAPRSLDRPTLAPVFFQLRRAPSTVTGLAGGLRADEELLHTGAARYELALDVIEDGEGYELRLEYRSDLFAPVTAGRLLRRYRTVLEAMVADPASMVASLELMDAAERTELDELSHGPVHEVPQGWRGSSVAAVVAGVTEVAPTATAVLDGDELWTYAQLDAVVRHLVTRLRVHGVGPGDRVGLHLERSAESIAATLAVWRCGATVVPLDPTYPVARLASMVGAAQVAVVLAARDGIGDAHAVAGDLPVVSSHDGSGAVGGLADADDVIAAADAPAAVLFTSGSTGSPRGVALTHEALLNRAAWMQRLRPWSSSDVGLHRTPLGFVDWLQEVVGPLTAGAAVAVAGDEVVRDPQRLAALIERHAVSRATFVPSMLGLLLDVARVGHRLRSLRLLVSSGEPLASDLAARVLEQLPDCELRNIWGSTEVAADATCQLVDPRDVDGDRPGGVPIGTPIDNLVVAVVDRSGRPQPIGVPGELVVAGPQVAAGYLGNDAADVGRFAVLPAVPDAPCYRTGDVGVWGVDGVLRHLGRLDRQVKVRGARVEPGEVETVLRSVPGVHDAIVDLRPIGGDGVLVAWVVGTAELDQAAVKAAAAVALPAPAVPSLVQVIPALPRLPSGKVDRAALVVVHGASPSSTSAPLTATEAQVADLWQMLLELPELPPRDLGFFDAGGSSLLAVALAVQLEELLGVDVPPARILEAPTVAEQAAFGRRGRPPWVHMRDGTDPTAAPVVIVAGIPGTVLGQVHVSEVIEPRRTILGLEHPGIEPGDEPADTIEEHARRQVTKLADLDGPFILFGPSFGGLVAYEMARQLCAAGRPPLQVILGDTHHPGLPVSRRRRVRRTPAEHVRRLPRVVRSRVAWARRLGRDRAPTVEARFDPVKDAANEARRRYRPLAPGMAVDVVVAGHSAEDTGDPTLGWGPVCGELLRVHEVPDVGHAFWRDRDGAQLLAGVLATVIGPGGERR